MTVLRQWLNALLTAVLFAVYVVLAKLIHHSFGTFVFRICKTNIPLRAVYIDYCKLLTCIKIDIAASFLNIISCHVFFFYKTQPGSLAFLGMLQVVKMLGQRGARHESVKISLLCLACLMIEPVYMLAQIVVAFTRNQDNKRKHPDWAMVLFVYIVSVLIRALLLRLAWRHYHNFGKGLKEQLDLIQDHQPATSSIEAVIASGEALPRQTNAIEAPSTDHMLLLQAHSARAGEEVAVAVRYS
jgi:hypothetical protein